MISTGRQGRAVAVVCGGSLDGTIIRLLEHESKEPEEAPRRHPSEVLEEEDFLIDPEKYRLLPPQQRLAIADAIAAGDFAEEDEDEEEDEPPAPVRAVHRRAAMAYRAKATKEYRIDDGKMVVLPDKQPERVFVAARSGAGKSCWAASYMREYLEMFPERKIYLFSTHEGEKAYMQIDHVAIPLDQAFAEALPNLEDLSASLCVFDDCDNLTDKKIATACDALNANLVANGRKYGIHVLTLAHMVTEYRRTRVQLMEANRTVLFPQGGSQYHNQRYLKVYAGLTSHQINAVLGERSRWVCLDLRAPPSYVTENAVVVLH
jgi:hypothetical protein